MDCSDNTEYSTSHRPTIGLRRLEDFCIDESCQHTCTPTYPKYH